MIVTECYKEREAGFKKRQFEQYAIAERSLKLLLLFLLLLSHRAEILVFLFFSCESRHKPDVKGLTAISFPGYLTRWYSSYYSSCS